MIQNNVELKSKNWFKTGGQARFYSEPANLAEFKNNLEFATQNKLDIFVLGAGANVLISDQGFDGLVIRPQLKNIFFEDLNDQETLVTAESGTVFGDLINFCLENNILGLEEFSGIPGTVGGAVFINIHFFKFLLSQFLIKATVIESKTKKTFDVDQNWFNFGYNQSRLQSRSFYLLSATFKLKKASDIETAYAKGRSYEIIRYRTWRYPSQNTCGSFFRNFYESEVSLEISGKKMVFVAYYLDKLGFKGELQHGGAIVSHQHANMLVNLGSASSSDLIALARQMQSKVLENFGIIPQPECLLIGFKDYPLLNQAPLLTQKNNSDMACK